MTVKTATIQPGQTSPMGALPYPLHIDLATGDVQHQSFWNGQISRVIGFQPDVNTQSIALWFEDFAANPEAAVGLVAVVVGDKGGLSSIGGPIKSVNVAERAEAIA